MTSERASPIETTDATVAGELGQLEEWRFGWASSGNERPRIVPVAHRCDGTTKLEEAMARNDRSGGEALSARTASMAQRFALAVGVVFLVVGVLGFVPGITSNYSDMQFAGHESEAELLGLFQVSILHNVVHLLFGLAGIWAARDSAESSIVYLIAGGVVYGVLALYGALIDFASDWNFVPLNTADNWLHLALAIGMVGLGVLARGEVSRTAPRHARPA